MILNDKLVLGISYVTDESVDSILLLISARDDSNVVIFSADHTVITEAGRVDSARCRN